MSALGTEVIIRNGLQHRYPSRELAAQFDEFVKEEEVPYIFRFLVHCKNHSTNTITNQYDSDLIQQDIMEEELDEIVEYLADKNSDLDKEELDQALKDILNAAQSVPTDEPQPEESPNNAEPHHNDQAFQQSLEIPMIGVGDSCPVMVQSKTSPTNPRSPTSPNVSPPFSPCMCCADTVGPNDDDDGGDVNRFVRFDENARFE